VWNQITTCAALKGGGLKMSKQCSISISQVWPFLYNPVGVPWVFAVFVSVCMKKRKSCNLNPTFCTMYPELKTVPKGKRFNQRPTNHTAFHNPTYVV